MADRAFTAFVSEVAAVCDRHRIPAHLDRDAERLERALWEFIHPDLAGTDTDPYHQDQD
jgi:hypothetical protein